MKNNLQSPCSECPFKKDSMKGWLGGETPEGTYHYVMNENDFACHNTRHKKLSQMSRCRGSLLFLKKACKAPKYNEELKVIVSKIDYADTENILLPHHFITHHTL